MTTKLYSRTDLAFILHAMMQGSGYWAHFTKIEHTNIEGTDVPKRIELTDVNEDTPHIVTLNDVAAAIDKVRRGEVKVAPDIRDWILSGEAGMIDADAGDVLMQTACFGEIQYG